MSRPRVRGKAVIKHATSGQTYSINPEDLYVDIAGGDQRRMGTANQYLAEATHPQLGTLTWEIWEYPVGVLNDIQTDVGPHQVIVDFEFDVSEGR